MGEKLENGSNESRVSRQIVAGDSIIWLEKDGILHCKLRPDGKVSFKKAKKIVEGLASLSRCTHYPLVLDLSDGATISPRSMFFFNTKDACQFSLAVAIVSEEKNQIDLDRFGPTPIPVRYFSDESSAKKWLADFVSHEPSSQQLMHAHKEIELLKSQLYKVVSQLEQSEQFNEDIVNNYDGCVLELDNDLIFNFVNVKATKWWDKDQEEFFNKDLKDIIGSEAFERERPYIDRALEGEMVVFDSQIVQSDGTELFIRTQFVPKFNAHGNTIGLYLLIDDLTHEAEIKDDLINIRNDLLENYHKIKIELEENFPRAFDILKENLEALFLGARELASVIGQHEKFDNSSSIEVSNTENIDKKAS